MTLVEQAARRLEQMRKSGLLVGADALQARDGAHDPRPAPESVIERAARKLNSLERKTAALEPVRRPEPAPVGEAEAAAGKPPLAEPGLPIDDTLEWGDHTRREPRLEGPVDGLLLDTGSAAPDAATLRARPQRPTHDESSPSAREASAPTAEAHRARADRDGLQDLDASARAPRAHTIRSRPRHAGQDAGERHDVGLGEAQTRRAPQLELDLATLSAQGFLTPDRSDSALADQLRLIKRPIINAAMGKTTRPVKHGNRVMLSSALAGEGKSFIALNLAMSIAMERDSRVLLIDADTTRPSLSRIVGASLSHGLLDLLTSTTLAPEDTLLRTNVERLSFLPCGTARPNATELLASEAMEQLVLHLASRYPDRILIFDAPPLLAAPEPAVLAGYMGQIVVVVEAERTTHKVAQQALAAVEGCPVVMTVLNKADGSDARHDDYRQGGR